MDCIKQFKTLLERIKRLLAGSIADRVPETTSTVGLNVSKCDFDGIICQFWDLGGASDLQSLWSQYYPESHAVFFVIDASDSARAGEALNVFKTLMENDNIQNVPISVLANKQDLLDSDCENIIEDAFIECRIFKVSAQTGAGIVESLEWLIKAVNDNSANRPPNFV